MAQAVAAPPPVVAPRGRAGVALLVLLGALTAIGPLSLDMYLPAFPRIAADLAVPEAQVQLSLTTCLIGLALGQLIGGPLSDRYGRRRPALIGAGLYAALSLLCAAAPNPGLLAGVRFAEGLAGGVGVVVARAVVRDLYSGVAAARYFSRLTLVFGLAPIAAPSLGSLVLKVTDWRGVFVALGAIGVLLTAAVAWRLPETLPPAARVGGGLRQTLRAGRGIATDRLFVGYTLTQGLSFAALFAYISGSPFVIQEVFGASPTTFSLLFGLNAVGLVLVGQLNARLLDRVPPRRLLLTALTVAIVAGLGANIAVAAHSLPALAASLFILVATIGMTTPNGTALALDRHPGIAGTAAALMGAAQSVIGAIAAPLVGLGGEGTGRPMALVILGCATLSLLAVTTLTRHPSTTP